MLQSEILASTSGHTAACVVLYSAIRSGLMPITMPMRFITFPPIADLSLRSLLVLPPIDSMCGFVLMEQPSPHVIPASVIPPQYSRQRRTPRSRDERVAATCLDPRLRGLTDAWD